MNSGALVLAALDAIGRVIWHSMLQVLPAEGCADGCCRRSVGDAGEIAASDGSGDRGWRQRCDGHERRFESISLQQTVRLSPDFTRASEKAPVFRHCGGDAGRPGRERHRGAKQHAKRSASVSVGRYSSTAVLPDAARQLVSLTIEQATSGRTGYAEEPAGQCDIAGPVARRRASSAPRTYQNLSFPRRSRRAEGPDNAGYRWLGRPVWRPISRAVLAL